MFIRSPAHLIESEHNIDFLKQSLLQKERFLMHVTKNVSDTSTVYSNEMIDERNRLIKKIAEDEHNEDLGY